MPENPLEGCGGMMVSVFWRAEEVQLSPISETKGTLQDKLTQKAVLNSLINLTYAASSSLRLLH